MAAWRSPSEANNHNDDFFDCPKKSLFLLVKKNILEDYDEHELELINLRNLQLCYVFENDATEFGLLEIVDTKL